MPVGQRSQSPARLPSPSGSRRQSFLSMSTADQQSMATFSHFPYENALSPFTLTAAGDGTSAEAGLPVYSHNPTGTYHLAPTSHSGYGSPTSNQSSPSPYGDFNAFPLSPPSPGGTLSSFISQQHQTPHGQLAQHQQPLSSMDLSSPLNPSTFEISSTGAQTAQVPQRQPRRDSYSTTATDLSYDRRHSTVSVGSLRSLQPASPYSSYVPLDNNAGAHSQIYGSPALSANVPNQSLMYMDPGRQTVPPAPTLTSSPHLVQSNIVNEVPRLTNTPVPQMGPPLQPPSKLATRQYRKKTPPVACAVCGINDTPEWRKGPSGPRTLCNACGLTAAKQAVTDPKSVEEVWKQLSEIGSMRFRGNYTLGEDRKASAAQNWSSQSHSSGRQSNTSRYSYSASATTSPTSRSTRMSFASIPGQQPRPSANSRNPAEIDAAQQLFSMSRGRGNSLGATIPLSSSTLPPPGPLTHMNPYGVPASPRGASLNMSSSSGSHDTAQLAYQPQQLSPATCHSQRRMLEMYSGSINTAAVGHSHHGRRNSIGGHRMSISSIINQDPPSRPTSSMNTNAQIQQFQHQQQARHLHHQLLLHHSSEAEYPN